jgi:hypothetical protein
VSYIHFSARGMIGTRENFSTNHPVPVFIYLCKVLAEFWTGLIFSVLRYAVFNSR